MLRFTHTLQSRFKSISLKTIIGPANASIDRVSEPWRAGIKEPFEIHVHPPEKAAIYKNRAKLLRI